MINLFAFKGQDGIVRKKWTNDSGYIRYLDRRLFESMRQPVFCPKCGRYEVDPKDFGGELKFCPRCGYQDVVWEWNSAVKIDRSVDIFINGSPVNTAEIMILLMQIAAKRCVKLNWFTKVGDEIKPLVMH